MNGHTGCASFNLALIVESVLLPQIHDFDQGNISTTKTKQIHWMKDSDEMRDWQGETEKREHAAIQKFEAWIKLDLLQVPQRPDAKQSFFLMYKDDVNLSLNSLDSIKAQCVFLICAHSQSSAIREPLPCEGKKDTEKKIIKSRRTERVECCFVIP